jgi:hypothetical protein
MMRHCIPDVNWIDFRRIFRHVTDAVLPMDSAAKGLWMAPMGLNCNLSSASGIEPGLFDFYHLADISNDG